MEKLNPLSTLCKTSAAKGIPPSGVASTPSTLESTMAVTEEGKFIVSCGGGDATKRCWRLDLEKSLWEDFGNMTTARRGASMIQMPYMGVWVMGGMTDNAILARN